MAACAAEAIFYPLDAVNRRNIYREYSSTLSGKEAPNMGSPLTVISVYKNEGFMRLFAGLNGSQLNTFSHFIAYLTLSLANGWIQNMLEIDLADDSSVSPAHVCTFVKDTLSLFFEKISFWERR